MLPYQASVVAMRAAQLQAHQLVEAAQPLQAERDVRAVPGWPPAVVAGGGANPRVPSACHTAAGCRTG